MSKYNKGDKFILEVDSEVYEGDMANLSPKYYTLKGLSGLAIIEESLDKLQKCETELSWDEAYIKGLEDAWELADKINNMPMQEVINVYGFITDRCSVFKKNTSQEALAKLKAYEKSKEIEVGDVVAAYNQEGIVVGYMYGIDECDVWMYGYESPQCINKSEIKKTGKHIDINSVLEQLRGE